MNIVLIIISIFLVFASSVCEAIVDKIMMNYRGSVFSKYNDKYWDPKISDLNCYNNGNPNRGDKFRYSSNLLKFLTSARMFFKICQKLFIFGAIVTIYFIHLKPIFLLILIIGLIIFSWSTFLYFYKKFNKQ